MKRIYTVTICLIATLITLVSAAWAVEYRFVDIGALAPNSYSYAYDINDSGQVVGWSKGSAFIWDAANGMRALPTPPGHTGAAAYSINNRGQIVGAAGKSDHTYSACIWEGDSVQVLDMIGNDKMAAAYSINDSGQVVGYSRQDKFNPVHAFIWDSTNGARGIDNLQYAMSINNSGQVAGYTYAGNYVDHAFIWDSTNGMRDLGVLSGRNGSWAYCINNNGQVVGRSYVGDGDDIYDNAPFMWDSTSGMKILSDIYYSSGYIAYANNDNGIIVGRGNGAAFIWQDTIIHRGPSDSEAHAVNNNGVVAGWYNSSGTYRACIWEPVPEPASILALLCGLGGLLARRRK